jgi:deazaflavin-dependent oxidoreductase (nitroreductase family)
VDYLDLTERSWPILNRVTAGHVAVYRLSHGLVGHCVPGMPPMLLLDHVGARSGRQRTSPLLYMRDGENVVIVASKGGNPSSPGWFYNMRANPDTTVQIGWALRPVHARVAKPRERKRLWPKVVKLYGGYAAYQRRTEREIPLVILEPR